MLVESIDTNAATSGSTSTSLCARTAAKIAA
jgi:hypothetical protein